jgi:hypothetical protein
MTYRWTFVTIEFLFFDFEKNFQNFDQNEKKKNYLSLYKSNNW